MRAASPDEPDTGETAKKVDILEEKTGTGGGLTLWATSKMDYPVTLTLSLTTLDNLTSSAKSPIVVVVPPKKRVLVTKLSRIERRRATRYNISYTTLWGWRDSKSPAVLEYDLPFPAGHSYRVGQGYNGEFSHQGKNAVDFSLPEGATICAAREGTVIEVVQRYSEGGTSDEFKTKANRILILHPDGTLGRYAHLQLNGALVKVGQKVKTGDPIGKSGHTGYAAGPHLHFQVDRAQPGNDYESLPVKFRSSADPKGRLPEKGLYMQRPLDPSGSGPPGSAKDRSVPLNAIDGLLLCEGVNEADGTPIRASRRFRSTDSPTILFKTVVPLAESRLVLTIRRDGRPPGKDVLWRRELDARPEPSVMWIELPLADLPEVRGNCLLQISAITTAPGGGAESGQSLGGATFRVD